MEKILCEGHGAPCVLKTSLKGPGHHSTFYMCAKKPRCSFILTTSLPMEHCRAHGAVIGLRTWHEKIANLVLFKCSLNKSAKYCGHYRAAEQKENIAEARDHQKHTISGEVASVPNSHTAFSGLSDLNLPTERSSSNVSHILSIENTKSYSSSLESSATKSLSGPDSQSGSDIISEDSSERSPININEIQRGNGFELLKPICVPPVSCQSPESHSWSDNDANVTNSTEKSAMNDYNCLKKASVAPGSVAFESSDLAVSHSLCSSSSVGIEDIVDHSPTNESPSSTSINSESVFRHHTSPVVSSSRSQSSAETDSSLGRNSGSEESNKAVAGLDDSPLEKSVVKLRDTNKSSYRQLEVISVSSSEDEAMPFIKPFSPTQLQPSLSVKVSETEHARGHVLLDSESSEDEGSAKPTRAEDLAGDDGKQFQVGHQRKKVLQQYREVEYMLQTKAAHLPDGGKLLQFQKKQLEKRLKQLRESVPVLINAQESLTSKQVLAQSKTLTSGAIVHLHKSIEDCPGETTHADDPPGLTVSLMPHQKRALAWMMWREGQLPAGGILADDMGLGKTLSMLSLVKTKKKSREELDCWLKQPISRPGLIKSKGTLVVCPASLMLQWEAEIRSKLGHNLTVYVYHGKKITDYPYDLKEYDVVVTTYNLVGLEGTAVGDLEEVGKKKKRSVAHTTLFKIHWTRVILDEAHTIRNPKSAMSLGACALHAEYRWAVTGTPVQNNLKDFYSLIKFIHLAPFDDYRIWKDTVEKKGSLGMQRLNTMVSGLVLRRTKDEIGGKTICLPEKVVTEHAIQLNDEENNIHQYIYNEARKVMMSWITEKGEDVTGATSVQEIPVNTVALNPDFESIITALVKQGASASARGSCVLWYLLRLRQSCCHMKLLVSSLDGSVEPREDVDIDLRMEALSLDSEPNQPINMDDLPRIFSANYSSTKTKKVLQKICRISALPDHPPQKCVIVSQWTKMLDIVEYQLSLNKISFTRIDGKVKPAERLSRVNALNSPHKDPSVMLLSLQAGGVGLNLIGANHVFILDMHWNPALEQQAADRCHRVGQTREVYIHKFVCKDTVEERISGLQRQKLKLADSVLSGASKQSRVSASRLTIDDLKNLFELH